jgi:hypothetical protein
MALIELATEFRVMAEPGARRDPPDRRALMPFGVVADTLPESVSLAGPAHCIHLQRRDFF